MLRIFFNNPLKNNRIQCYLNQKVHFSNDIFKRIKFPDPIISVFEAANNYHLGRIDLAAQKVAEIEADYGLSVERLIQDEPYRKEEMKSMLEPILKSSALV